MDIHNSARFMDYTDSNYEYHLFELWIPIFRIMDFNKWAE